MAETHHLFAMANLLLALSVIGMCLCRLNAMREGVLYRVQGEYAVYLTCAMASGLSPLWGEWPSWGQLAVTGSLVFGLFLRSHEWRNGPPPTAFQESLMDDL